MVVNGDWDYWIKADYNPEWVLWGDNPGDEEQMSRRYLSANGRAGKAARRCFASLVGIKDFDHKVLVLNKCPIHTHETNGLEMVRKADPAFYQRVEDLTADFAISMYRALSVPTLVFGLGKCRKGRKDKGGDPWARMEKGLFSTFFQRIGEMCVDDEPMTGSLFIAKHFSRGHFERQAKPSYDGEPLTQILSRVQYKQELCAHIRLERRACGH